jgi:lipopolysaccharide/colanic/teichoic acid biosynthesis glycosyltransferase
MSKLYKISKRMFDILISLVLLAILSPFLLLIALLIKAEDGGSIFYISNRIGLDAKPIRFYKFRTMVKDADKLKEQLIKFSDRKDNVLFKMKDDPRITHIGKVLRKYSIDEIPQFINVVIGNISIVGPRPHLPSEVKFYTKDDLQRLSIKPGITCLPQLYGRNTLSLSEWIKFDLQYIQKRSLTFDCYILIKTFDMVITPFIPFKEKDDQRLGV